MITSWALGVTWVINVVLLFTECHPFYLNWEITVPPQKCAVSVHDIKITMANTVADFI